MSSKNGADGNVVLSRGLLFGVALISGASLMLELTLTRIFSVTLFYHFAFLVVSLALFGMGVAGIVVYLRGRSLRPERLERILAFHALAFGFSSIVALWMVLATQVPPGLGLESLRNLAALYLVAALPFFFSGMCLAMVITLQSKHVSRIYGYDLTGAALGCLLSIPALNLLGGPSTVLAAGALGASAAILFAQAPRRRLVAAGLASLLWVLVIVDASAGLFAVPSVKAIDESQVIFARWNSYSRVTVSKTREDHHWMNIDSDAATRIFAASAYRDGARANLRFSETRLASLVYEVRNGGHALIIGPGGGADVIAARQYGVKKITGVELNGLIAEEVMKEAFREYTGDLYLQDDVEVIVGEGRSFVRRAQDRYDSIQATLVDTWAATSAGAFTLSENTLYTQEAFGDFIEHLTDHGVLSMTRWLRQPPREFVRLISLGVAALRNMGVRDLRHHFFVARDNRMASFLLKKTPFLPEELTALRAACRRDRLRVMYDPEQPDQAQNMVSTLIRSDNPAELWRAHPLDISPPTDDRPFFFYTVKPENFAGQLFSGAAEKNDIGVQVLSGLLLVVLFLVLLFFLVPLLLFRRADVRVDRGRKMASLMFFAAIGVGFIALEISWMQHFVLFLGHPIYALGVVLFVLLLAGGTGSSLTQKIPAEAALARVMPTVIALALVVVAYSFLLGPLFRALVGLPLWLRILLAGAILVLPGLIMGRMMPLGIKALTTRFAEVVPWAWGINGAASVLGSVLVVAVSMNVGYRAAQILAVSVYLIGCVLLRLGLRPAKTNTEESPPI